MVHTPYISLSGPTAHSIISKMENNLRKLPCDAHAISAFNEKLLMWTELRWLAVVGHWMSILLNKTGTLMHSMHNCKPPSGMFPTYFLSNGNLNAGISFPGGSVPWKACLHMIAPTTRCWWKPGQDQWEIEARHHSCVLSTSPEAPLGISESMGASIPMFVQGGAEVGVVGREDMLSSSLLRAVCSWSLMAWMRKCNRDSSA